MLHHVHADILCANIGKVLENIALRHCVVKFDHQYYPAYFPLRLALDTIGLYQALPPHIIRIPCAYRCQPRRARFTGVSAFTGQTIQA